MLDAGQVGLVSDHNHKRLVAIITDMLHSQLKSDPKVQTFNVETVDTPPGRDRKSRLVSRPISRKKTVLPRPPS
jgi:hypothetical protein